MESEVAYESDEWDWMVQLCMHRPDPVVIAQYLIADRAAAGQTGVERHPEANCKMVRKNPVERLLICSQAAALLARAIAGLNVRERVVLHLAYVEQLSLGEVAALLNYGLARTYLIKKQSLNRLHFHMITAS